MNKTLTVMTMHNKDLNIGSLLFTETYLSTHPINTVTTKPFTEAEIEKLPQSGFTAPEQAMIAITSYNDETILWFDKDAAKAVTSHQDPLHIEGKTICTADHMVVATAISELKKVDLSDSELTACHTAYEKLEDGSIRAYKTDKIEDTDSNSLVLIEGMHFKNAIIEYDSKAELLPDAPALARGFHGVGFRVSDNTSHFEGLYIRPTNGKGCTDPYRKAHGCQYFAYPGYVWHYLREFGYEGYEAEVSTIELSKWAHIRIELIDDTAKYYVDDNLVLSLEHNMFHKPESGKFGFWMDLGAMAYFKNLYIEVLD